MDLGVLAAGFLQNLGIAAIVALGYDMLLRQRQMALLGKAATAVIFAAGSIGSMSLPVELAPGLIFDLRNTFVILAMSYGGWLAVITTSVTAALYRLWLGGVGAPAGALGIAFCALGGIAFTLYFRPRRMSTAALAFLGLMAGGSLVTVLVLPTDIARMIIEKMGLPMTAANIIGAVVVGKILERQRMQYRREAELSQEASTDALTNLPNRRTFDRRGPEMLAKAVQAGQPCTIMLIDIDHFKSINDTLGHDIGDEVLRQLSAMIQANVRRTDLVARFGGEEIALVLPTYDARRAFSMADRLRRAVAQTAFEIDGHQVRLNISIGLYTSESKDVSFTDAFKHADMALYRAKSGGRNRVELGMEVQRQS